MTHHREAPAWHEACRAAKRENPALTSQQLAQRFGVKYPAVNKVLGQLANAVGGRRRAKDSPPLTEEHKEKVRAGLLLSPHVNSWTPEEQATARNLYEQGVNAREVADTLNNLYKRGRTPQSVTGRMHRCGVVWGSMLNLNEIEDPEFARQIRAVDRRRVMAAEEAEAFTRRVYHPLKDNTRLLALLSR